MKNLSIKLWRWALIILCLIIAGVTFVYMNQNYDPLARYPYVEEDDREVILANLSDEDIDYMIMQQLKPSQFMPFITLNDFNIRNTVYYAIAAKEQPESEQDIVYFVNRYKPHFNADSLKAYLKHYSYDDLINFFETQLVLNEDLKLVENPEDPYLLLGNGASVYKYVPDELATVQNVQVKADMKEDLESMIHEYENTMDKEDTLELLYGYLSYEEILSDYNKLNKTFGVSADKLFLSGGENEAQLGYSIALKETEDYFAVLKENMEVLTDRDYDALEEKLDEKLLEKISWLENNAWRYGFVVRYDRENTNSQGHIWQPFLLRYVGKENAKAMHEAGKDMESFKFVQSEEK